MTLELLDDDLAVDADGREWRRHGDHWRWADELPEDADAIQVKEGLFGWRPIPSLFSVEIEFSPLDLVFLRVKGRRWVGGWRALIEGPFGRYYQEFLS